jgi:hypothetical protein
MAASGISAIVSLCVGAVEAARRRSHVLALEAERQRLLGVSNGVLSP